MCTGVCRWALSRVRWALELAGVWFACIVGIALSLYGFIQTKRHAVTCQGPTTTGLDDAVSAPISIIIPTHNEEGNLSTTVPSQVEIVVADGNSTDNTLHETHRLSDELQAQHVRMRVVSAVSGGRGGSLNAGAAAATHPILLFLHADTLLPLSFDNHIRACVADPANVAGAFTFGVNRSSFKRRCPVGVGTMEMFANFRAKHFLLPYGDQAMFMTRNRYLQVGPFPETVMMEDFELTRRIRRQAVAEGGRYPILPSTALCDGRRWEMNGVLKNTLLNQYYVWLYTSRGYTPEQIYQLYYARKVRTGKPPGVDDTTVAGKADKQE